MSARGNGPGLSERERQIAFLAAQGLTDKEVQRRLGLSGSTIATYWKRIRQKLNTANRAEAIAKLLSSSDHGPAVFQNHRLAPGAHTCPRSQIEVTWALGRWLYVANEGCTGSMESKPNGCLERRIPRAHLNGHLNGKLRH
jgi:DNA-binding CsgD family transcriptional regulator